MSGLTFYLKELDNSAGKATKIHSILSQLPSSHPIPDPNYVPHSNRVNKSFAPLRWILIILGRWPFHLETKNFPTSAWESTIHLEKSQVEFYTPSLKSPIMAVFIFTTTFLVIVLILSILGFCDFFLQWNFFTKSAWDDEERKNFQANLVPFVLVWSCLMHSSLSSLSLIINRKGVVKFLNYWNIALDALEMEVPKGMRRFIILNNIWFGFFIIGCFVCYRVLYLHIIRGGASLMGILAFRPFISSLDASKDFSKVRLFGVITILYAIYASRAFLIVYSFKTKLLRSGFSLWNSRFKCFMESSCNSYHEEKLNCEKLFEQYKVLLKLVRLTDNTFSVALASYYGSQLLNMCFELYYLAKSHDYDDSFVDTLMALIVLGQNVYIFHGVSLDAAYVSEEATKGFEILRCHGVHPEDSIYKKYLISNLTLIYSQRIVLTGGKFFALDRPFIVTVVGAVLTYFVIILQVGPSLHNKFSEADPDAK